MLNVKLGELKRMVGDIEGVVNAVRFSKPLSGQGDSTFYVVNYYIHGEWYTKSSPTKESLASEGDLVTVSYKEVKHKGEVQKRIESLEVIEAIATLANSEKNGISSNNRLKVYEIASKIVLASNEGKDVTIEKINELVLEQTKKISSYLKIEAI